MASVLFFASAREATGTKQWTSAASTVRGVLDEAISTFGEPLGRILPYCTIRVGENEASPDSVVADNDEVAILPPVSGG